MNSIELQEINRFANFELLAKQVVEGFITGLHRSPFHGFSVEFAEHRQYNTGESTRYIDWKLYARTEKLFIKRFEEETNLRCHILIDSSSSMYFPTDSDRPPGLRNKISFSALASAALIELMRRQRDAFGLSAFSDIIDFHTPDKSSVVHQKYLYHHLELLSDDKLSIKKKKSDTAHLLHQIAEMIHRRSLVVIFSDMFQPSAEESSSLDDIFSALQHMLHNRHEILLFHVTDKKHEIQFDFDDRPHRFIDLESGEEIKLHPAEIRQSYRKAISQFENELRLKCAQHRIGFVEADINEGFDNVLWNFLVKRSKQF
ncbi:MAG: DUF58 domain-containing protein [Candidatus Competibacteraceae bacterium]|nr:DUF58 domain-containing protein [Candidatus Competibacteraceae bacterium]